MTLHLVTGIAGQDGILLARHLQALGHTVIGTTHTSEIGQRACYLSGIEILPLDIRDTDMFAEIVAARRPDVVHNLAASSSVGQSWSNPDNVDEVNATAVIGMLDVLRALGSRAPKFVQASSSEIFGSSSVAVAEASTPLNPSSPYGESKARAHRAVQAARRDGVDATNLILFGHSSVLHAGHFVLPTIARQAAEVYLGKRTRIDLQDPSVARDWGSASDFAAAFGAAAEHSADDYVIATGVVTRLGDIATWALESLGALAVVGPSGEAPRPADRSGLRGGTQRAWQALGWQATTRLRTVVSGMAQVEIRRISSGVEEDPVYLR